MRLPWYLATGEFLMKGVKKSVKITFQVLENGKDSKGDYLLIAGKSSLNRTLFNMESDPKIGDLVDFKFQLELRR